MDKVSKEKIQLQFEAKKSTITKPILVIIGTGDIPALRLV
jgi:hypothetical protein